MRRIAIILLCAAMVPLLFAGCDQEKQPYTPTGDALVQGDGTLAPTTPEVTDQELSLVYYPNRSLNPFQATDYTNRVLFSLIYQGLFAVDRNYQAVPILCESFNVSADMRTYTFYIADASFSDGTSVTAGDVAASLNAAKGSPWYGGRLQHAASITSYGEAVVIDLDTPMENLPILLDIPIVKASQVSAAQPLGSGPYLLDLSLQGSWLRRQAGWWCSAELPVSADFITLLEAESPAQIRDAFEFSGASLVCTDPGSDDYVDFRSDYELWDSENGQFLYLACNEESVLFSDPDIRAALTHIIDRDALVDSYYHGFARSATLPASPMSPYYSQSLAENYGYDPRKFQDAIAAAAPESVDVTLLYNADDVIRRRVGQSIADMLEEAGLNVTIVESTSANFAADLRAGEYDLYLAQTKLSANMDLSAFFGTDTSLNYGGLGDPAAYAMSLEALANSGNYYNLYELVMDEGRLCPILFQSYAIYTDRGALSSLSPARDHLFYYSLGRTIEDALISGESA